jgi:hypothetical protein
LVSPSSLRALFHAAESSPQIVHGNNHFILAGPPPDELSTIALARH